MGVWSEWTGLVKKYPFWMKILTKESKHNHSKLSQLLFKEAIQCLVFDFLANLEISCRSQAAILEAKLKLKQLFQKEN